MIHTDCSSARVPGRSVQLDNIGVATQRQSERMFDRPPEPITSTRRGSTTCRKPTEASNSAECR